MQNAVQCLLAFAVSPIWGLYLAIGLGIFVFLYFVAKELVFGEGSFH